LASRHHDNRFGDLPLPRITGAITAARSAAAKQIRQRQIQAEHGWAQVFASRISKDNEISFPPDRFTDSIRQTELIPIA
jgi:hypothetical protein